MDTEQIIVREAFLAGLIDFDGCTRIQHGSIRAKISSAYPPIRDGIYSIMRSLGLNVTVHFKAARIGPSGLNESALWTFNIFGGSNRQTFLLILNRCAVEGKRNPPIQYSKERDREEFEEDSEEDEYRRELEEDAVDYSNKRACNNTADTSMSYEQDTALVANISDPDADSYSKHYGTPDPKFKENLTGVSEPLVLNDVTSFFTCYTKSAPDSYFDEHQGEEHRPRVLKPARMKFKVAKGEKDEVYGVISNESGDSFITDLQLTTGSSRNITEITRE